MSTTKRATSKDVEALLDGNKPKRIGGLNIGTPETMGKNFNILVYGVSGVGKTTLAGSASAVPDLSPVLFVDVEGGTLSLAGTYPKVEVVPVQSFMDIQKIYDELYKTGGSGYRTVILDSLTEAQKLSMKAIMRKASSENSDVDEDVPHDGEQPSL